MASVRRPPEPSSTPATSLAGTATAEDIASLIAEFRASMLEGKEHELKFHSSQPVSTVLLNIGNALIKTNPDDAINAYKKAISVALNEADDKVILQVITTIISHKAEIHPLLYRSLFDPVCEKLNSPDWNPRNIATIYTTLVFLGGLGYPAELFAHYHAKRVKAEIAEQLLESNPIMGLLVLFQIHATDTNRDALSQINAALLNYIIEVRNPSSLQYLFARSTDPQVVALQKSLISALETHLVTEEKSIPGATPKNQLQVELYRLKLDTTNNELKLKPPEKTLVLHNLKSTIVNIYETSTTVGLRVFETKTNAIPTAERNIILKALIHKNCIPAMIDFANSFPSDKERKMKLYLHAKIALLAPIGSDIYLRSIAFLNSFKKTYTKHVTEYLYIIEKAANLRPITDPDNILTTLVRTKDEEMLKHFREKRKETTGIIAPSDPHVGTSKKGIFGRTEKPHYSERDDLMVTIDQTDDTPHVPDSASPPPSPTWR